VSLLVMLMLMLLPLVPLLLLLWLYSQACAQAAERRSTAQLEELRQEVAVAQTALGLLGQSLGPGSSR
jgi:hypothetical protein